jgi:thiazole synthase ThiGH ThiG subunit
MNKLTMALAVALAVAAGSTAMAKAYWTMSAAQACAVPASPIQGEPNPADFGN